MLYGINGATAEECDELLELLQEFRTHVAALHLEGQFSELLAECEFHFNSYRTYLITGTPGGSYAAFLETKRPTS